MTSGIMDDGDAGIQCREMDIRRGRMTSGGKEEANAGFNPAEKKKGEIENPPLYGREGEFSRFREIDISRYRKYSEKSKDRGYLTSSKSTSSAVGPLEPLLSVGPACGPCGPA